MKQFQVYTYFGRVLSTFVIPENETHHKSQALAYNKALSYEKSGVTCWVRLK